MYTKYFSNRQEKRIAKKFGGKKVAASGATRFNKGDVSFDNVLVECKTCMKDKDSFSIKKQWLEKNKEESFSMNKEFSVLAFNYGPDQENYYIIDERTFKRFMEFVNEN